MKCPKCGGGVTVSFPRDFGFVHRCNCCGKEWNSRKAVDPVGFLRLIDAAKQRDVFMGHAASRPFFRIKLIAAIESYLSGDPAPLKEMAGDK